MNELQDDCVVCGPQAARETHKVDEAMFGIGESFQYAHCQSCGSLQILDVPTDLGRYYATDYYSFELSGLKTSPWLRRPPLRQALRANTWSYNRLRAGVGLWWARAAGLNTSDRILDLGCGSGSSLLNLHLLGYRHLAGADPFLEDDATLPGGVPLMKAAHSDVTGEYDWVLMHHSFEHVPDPRALLRSAHRLLGGTGRLLVRMPVMGARAWREYGTAWVQIDAPRHLVVFTPDGFARLAGEEGFVLEETVYDSTGFQFWGSEMARAGEPFRGGPGDRFSRQQLRGWEAEAKRLNAAQDGDQAMYILRAV